MLGKGIEQGRLAGRVESRNEAKVPYSCFSHLAPLYIPLRYDAKMETGLFLRFRNSNLHREVQVLRIAHNVASCEYRAVKGAVCSRAFRNPFRIEPDLQVC